MEQLTKYISPVIEEQRWGFLQVEGIDRDFKDAKLYPGGARTWDWNETGTRHKPGIQWTDVEELVENGAEIVVLSKGVQEALEVPGATVEALERRGVAVKIAQTEEAVKLYNELAEEGKAVGGLFHSTC